LPLIQSISKGKHIELLNIELETALSQLENTPSFYNLIKEGLTADHRKSYLHTVNSYPWSFLPLLVCEAICGKYEHSLPAVAALQFLRASAEILDDTEDTDKSNSFPAKYGKTAAINAATALIILAEKEITKLKLTGVNQDTVIKVIETINSHYITVCTGQHLDLTLLAEAVVSEELYYKIAEMKSAAVIKCACIVGALLAGANQHIVDSFGCFGQNLGIASQIANDILGITQKRDIIKPKVTLPVIYGLSQTNNDALCQLEQVFLQPNTSFSKHENIRKILFNSGAIYYATVKMELYKQRAQRILFSIQKKGINVTNLQHFLK